MLIDWMYLKCSKRRLSSFSPEFAFWFPDFFKFITGRQLLIPELQFFGTFFPGPIFWLSQTPISPRRKNSKPGSYFFSVICTNTFPPHDVKGAGTQFLVVRAS
jgi:hypothetical protein